MKIPALPERLPDGFKLEEGMTIGFDAQVNDAEGGSRVGISKWSDPTDDSWQSNSGWGELKLTSNTASVDASTTADADEQGGEDEQADSGTVPTSTDSDDTVFGDLMTVLAVIAGLVVGAILFLLLKKKNNKA